MAINESLMKHIMIRLELNKVNDVWLFVDAWLILNALEGKDEIYKMLNGLILRFACQKNSIKSHYLVF